MDFIVSKVAMSICALMVVAIVGGVLNKERLFDPGEDLQSILDGFCSVVDSIGETGTEGMCGWEVPFSSRGETITLTIDGGTVRAQTGTVRAVDQPLFRLRTWTIDSVDLNTTELNLLDSTAPEVVASSGRTLCISSRVLTLDNQQATMLFVAVQDQRLENLAVKSFTASVNTLTSSDVL